MGVTELSGDSRGALLAADKALYDAKAAGRNCVVPGANVLPGRHLSFIMPRLGQSPAVEDHGEDNAVHGRVKVVHREAGWMRIVARDVRRLPLTEREREVLGLVAGGLRGGEIAKHLTLSPETIKSHVRNAMTKLAAHTRAHAVAIGLTTGQIEIFKPLRAASDEPRSPADEPEPESAPWWES